MVLNPAGIATDDGIILLDVGVPNSLDALEELMADDRFDLSDVTMLLLAHQDVDHAGAAAEFAERTGAPVVAHREDAAAITGEERPIKTRDERYPPADVDIALTGGETFSTNAGPLEVIETPGHTPGHVSLYLPRADLLLSADALNGGDRLVGPREDVTPEMETAVRSVYTLSTLDFEKALCYHGGVVTQGSERVAEVFDDLREKYPGFETVHGSGRRFLRRELATNDVGLSRFALDAGDRHGSRVGGNTGHRHLREEEIYLFLKGSGTLKVDEREIDIEAGDAVKLAPYCVRAFEADEPTEFVAAGAPVQGDEGVVVDDFW